MTDTSLSSREKEIIQHSLGFKHNFGQDYKPISYRNRYITGPDCIDYDIVANLESCGLMEDCGAVHSPEMKMRYFRVTDKGKKAVGMMP